MSDAKQRAGECLACDADQGEHCRLSAPLHHEGKTP